MRVTDHLWTGGPAPDEYVELALCRDVFHCRPSELRKERWVDILHTLTCLKVEGQVASLRRKR